MRPRAPDFKSDAVPLRLAVADLDRALEALTLVEEEAKEGDRLGEEEDHEVEGSICQHQGLAYYHLARALREAERLYRRYDRVSERSEFPGLRRDLVSLAKLWHRHLSGHWGREASLILARMRRSYRALQQ